MLLSQDRREVVVRPGLLPGWIPLRLRHIPKTKDAVAGGKIADKKQQYADRAMELLRKAVKAGYKDAAHMKKDTDLDALRGREDFKKLLAELDKSSPAKPKS